MQATIGTAVFGKTLTDAILTPAERNSTAFLHAARRRNGPHSLVEGGLEDPLQMQALSVRRYKRE